MGAKIDEISLKKHKISTEEYLKIINFLGREPNLVELGIFSAMWSEHCSYKTTRIHLKKMYTAGKQVICGPGENAGIIDGLDDDAIVFKMESHNHPSFVEPFNGAATGVGGILRDIFTMGARPIATLNSLRFGDFKNPLTHRLFEGVVSGVGFYGNCVGIPSAGGEFTFDESYNTNNITNAMAIGIAKKDKIFYSAANRIGAKVVYFGSKTGRDGIHGASMSSNSFDDNAKANKSSVQIGDPFVGKLLMEACLELMAENCVLSIQDMGAAGLTCSCAEMAGKGDNGIEIDVSLVPLRDSHMSAYEIMLSESQERMLMILNDGQEEKAAEILKKWNLDFAVIGKITDTKRFIIKENGVTVCDLPIHLLSEEAPIYNRPFTIKIDNKNDTKINKNDSEIIEVLTKIISSPNMLHPSFIYERYDRGVGDISILSSPEPAGVLKFGKKFEGSCSHYSNESRGMDLLKSQILLQKLNNKACSEINFIGSDVKNDQPLKYETQKGLAVTSKCIPRYVLSNPKEGSKHGVATTYRNLCAVGATPLAITNCLNFGNPEIPEIMGQIVASIDGISESAKILDYPVVSGNVSLYNQTNEICIKPTPVIGGVGIMKDSLKVCSSGFKSEEEFIFLIGETKGHITNTVYANVIENLSGGMCPAIDLETEKLNGHFIRKQIENGFITACSSVSDGGMLCTVSEMIINSKNNIGASLMLEGKTASLSLMEYSFSEDASRYVCTVPKSLSVKFFENLINEGIIYTHLGFTCKDVFEINSKFKISIEELRTINTFPGFTQ